MTEGPRRRHLSLVRRRDTGEAVIAPQQIREQLSLFYEAGSSTLAVLQPDGVQEGQFIEWIHTVRPRLIVDTRLSPRFDLGSLNRKAVFALFQQANATYIDLASKLTSHQPRLPSEELDLAIKSLLAMEQDLVGPILFLTDSRIANAAVLELAARSLSTSAGRAWQYLLLQTQVPHAQSS